MNNNLRHPKMAEQLEPRVMLTTFVVDTLSDIIDAQDNRTSLREAVLSANQNPGEDEIQFADHVSGRLLLQNGELTISDSVRIVGPGAHRLTIDALGNDPTPQENNGDGSPAFSIVRERREPYSYFHLSDVTVTGADGRAMSLALGSLTRVVVEGNRGGGISIAEPLSPVANEDDAWFRITDSVFRDNYFGTSFSQNGGAIGSRGKLHIERTLFEDNRANDAGAIRAANSIRIEDSVFINNFAKGDGGAIYGTVPLTLGATFDVYNSVFANNIVDNFSIDSPDGSAMAIRGFADVKIVGSTISGNESRTYAGALIGDGAIDFRGGGAMTIDRTTIVNNFHTGEIADAASYGGVVQWDGALRIYNSVIAQNSGEQVRLSNENSVFYSFIGTSPDGRLPSTNGVPDRFGNIVGGPFEMLDPMLEELADNGAGMLTHMPAPDSPLINSGEPSFVAESARMEFDQRGEPFHRIVDNRIDMGAIEYSPPAASPFTFFDHDVACCNLNRPTSLDSGDIDGDGDIDIIIGSFDEGSIVWFDNRSGSLDFGVRHVVTTAADSIQDVRLIDLDGDGDLDVVSASYGEQPVAWFENDGRGSFGAVRLISDRGAFRVTAADIDRDGDLDIATISKQAGTLEWHRNDGNARFFFGPFTVEDNLQNPDSLELVDLNIDRTPDFLVGGTTSHVLLWYENQRRGTATREHTVSANIFDSFDALPVDMDGDGDLDVVTAIVIANRGQYFNDLIWMENTNGRGALTVGHDIAVSLSGTEWIEPADVDGDGDMDVVVALYSEKELVWFENLGNSTAFARRSIGTRLPDVFDGTIADFDRDGDIEIVVASESDDQVTLFDSATNVRSPWTASPVNPPTLSHTHVGDLDGDGMTDVVAINSETGDIFWFRNLGQEQFGSAQLVGRGWNQASMLQVADLDGNGVEDVVASTRRTIDWFQGQGNGQFGPRNIVGLGFQGILSYEIVDVDANGSLDIIVTAPDSLSWIENEDGTADPSRPQPIAESVEPRWSAVGRVDADNRVDIVAGLNDSLVWYRNQVGPERFSSSQTIDSHKLYTHGAIADVDGDGDSDIVVIEKDSRVEHLYWYRNDQDSFSERIRIEGSLSPVDEISLTDFDSDGDIDVILTQSNSRRVTWVEGLGGGEFGRSAKIATMGEEDSHIADLDHDGNQDLLFANGNKGHVRWIEQRIPGDSNNDGLFDSSDLVAVFIAAEYEDGIPNNSTFAEGDWNLDGDFDTTDLVLAFRSGRYGQAALSKTHEIAAAIDSIFDTDDGRMNGINQTSKFAVKINDEMPHRELFVP